MLATSKRHTDIVKVLLALPGIDVNMKNKVRKLLYYYIYYDNNGIGLMLVFIE